MKPATSIGVLLASTLVVMAGFGSVGPLAQVSSPPTETMPPPGAGAGVPIEAPTAEPPASPEAVQERRVPGLLPPGSGILQQPAGALPPAAGVQPPNTFYVVSYGGKCLDFGGPSQVSGSPVVISWCNGTIAQQVQVEEINDRHEVILHAGTKVIGVRGATAPPVLSRGTAPQIQSLTRPPAPFSQPPPVALTPLPAQVAPPPPMALQPPAYVGTTSDVPLELQDLADVDNPTAGQIFALDGDSIILVADRTRVVQVQNKNRGANQTMLVLGHRDLADAEFWTFVAADKTPRKPTSGFRWVPQIVDLTSQTNAFVAAVLGNSNSVPPIPPSGYGTVIEVDPNVSIDLSNHYLLIPGGVTIRSNRRGLLQGPKLWTSNTPNGTMLEIGGNDVRITGLRLEGPNTKRDTESSLSGSRAILVRDNIYLRSIIDHNDISDWITNGVGVWGGDDTSKLCPTGFSQDPRSRPNNVRVARNFIHDNLKLDEGYGVEAHSGGFPLIEGNMFVNNRHAIASAGEGAAQRGYRAWYNLVLSDAPLQHDLFHTQDFDMHGSGDGGFGGIAGEYMDIARNTFLGTQYKHENFDLRDEPCYLADFHHNISLEGYTRTNFPLKGGGYEVLIQGGAIACSQCGAGINKLNVHDNHFDSGNPTDHLGVGDFDGDGRDDLFLATGAAWYYAPAGQAEWRFLNAQTDGMGTLLFGDFDADGRTDVFTQHGANWDVSWSGASQWETINVSEAILGNTAIGDFDGDHHADVFYADGQYWNISYGGVGQWTRIGPSSFLVRDLGFGDFNLDSKTDIVGAVSGQWMVAHGGPQGIVEGWQPLRSALTNTMAGLIIADFNGNGRSDIASMTQDLIPANPRIVGSKPILKWNVRVAWDGKSDWRPLPTIPNALPGSLPVIGRFDSTGGADIVYFEYNDNHLDIRSSGIGPPVRYSRQDMR